MSDNKIIMKGKKITDFEQALSKSRKTRNPIAGSSDSNPLPPQYEYYSVFATENLLCFLRHSQFIQAVQT